MPMASIQLFHGPGISDKIRELIHLCLQRIDQSEHDRFVILVPTNRWLRYLTSHFLHSSRRSVLPELAIFNLQRFIHHLAPLTESHLQLIDDSLQELIIENLLNTPDYRRIFAPEIEHAPFPDLVRQLCALLNELRDEGYTPQTFEQRCRSIIPTTTPKLNGLISTFRDYQRFLEHHKLADEPLLARLVTDSLDPEAFSLLFPNADTLYIMGFDVFSKQTLRLISALSRCIPSIEILLDYQPHRPRLFQHLEPSFAQLTALSSTHSFLIGQADAPLSRSSIPAPAHALKQHLYAQLSPLDPKIPAQDFITVMPAKTREQEVERIAQWIKQKVLSSANTKSLSLNSICLCFPRLDKYLPLIRDCFASYGIPANISWGFAVSQSPVANAILSLLELVSQNYHRAQLLRVLNSPYFHITYEPAPHDHQPIPIDLLNTISVKFLIVDGKHAWLDGIERERQRIELHLERLRSGLIDNSEGGSDPQDADKHLSRHSANLQALHIALRSFFAVLEPLESPRKLSEFRSLVRDLLNHFQLPKRLLFPDNAIPLELVQHELSALNAFMAALDDTVRLAPLVNDRQFSLEEFVNLLRLTFYKKRYYLPLDEAAGVQVLGKLEPRGLEFDFMIIGGLVEGEFPAPGPLPIFLPSELRERLGLQPKSTAISEDRFLFFHYLGLARTQLLLTYPQTDGEELLLPSSIIDEVTRCADVSWIKDEPTAPRPIFSITSLQKLVGESLIQASDPEQLRELFVLVRSLVRSPHWHDLLTQLLHALRISDLRTRSPELTQYEGMITDPVLLERLARRYATHAFSVSQLELYAQCPFAFFCQRVLGIEPPEELEEEITPLERGSLIHTVLYRFYTEWRARDLSLSLTDANFNTLKQHLIRIASEELSRYPYRGLFWQLEQETLIGSSRPNGRRGVLVAFLEQESAQAKRGPNRFSPAFFEISFGATRSAEGLRDPLSSATPYVIQTPHGPIQLSGKVDRVDLLNDQFLIIDYKSSKTVPDIHELEDGLSLQLPIYISAIEGRLQKKRGKSYVPAGACYYVVRDEANCQKLPFLLRADAKRFVLPSKSRFTKGIVEDQKFRAYLSLAHTLVLHYVSRIRQGFFHPALSADGSNCQYCDYFSICRIDFQRMDQFTGRLAPPLGETTSLENG
jgi:ATP-dependent helicase/nuclease subunit B